MRVLIADDLPDNRELVIDILTASGYETLSAADGEEALELIREYLPDLVILDISMPIKDGFEVCEEMKQDPETAQLPVIMLTAHTDIDSRVRGLGLGADDYLSKPFNPRELLARVNTRLRAKAETDELRQQRLAIRQTFERFVSPAVVEALMENPEAAQLGGALREITVIFADIEGFTSMSEHADPVHLLNILNRYHGLMVHFIKRNKGTVDKYLGDGIMAVYNAPLEQPDHALSAVRTAIEIREALYDFHQDIPPEFRVNINFGINTGQAVVGNVGTEDTMDYTAIGDNVNLAQRLESVSTNGQIMISEATFHQIAHAVEVTSGKMRQIKGRKRMVMTYLVTGLYD